MMTTMSADLVQELRSLATDTMGSLPDDDERLARRLAEEISQPSCVGHYTCLVRAVAAGMRAERNAITPTKVEAANALLDTVLKQCDEYRATITTNEQRLEQTVAAIRKALEWLRLSDEEMSPSSQFSQIDHAMLTLGECLLQLGLGARANP